MERPLRRWCMSIEARRLTSADLAAYRALHRFALEEAPHAFAQTLEQDAAQSDEAVAVWLDRGEVWGVLKDGALAGKLVMDALPYPAFAHTRWLHAVYLHPAARGTGAGAVLMEAAAAQAKAQGVTHLLLWVHAENQPARAFYEKLGFRQTGIIPGGIRIGNRFVDDILMWLPLG